MTIFYNKTEKEKIDVLKEKWDSKFGKLKTDDGFEKYLENRKAVILFLIHLIPLIQIYPLYFLLIPIIFLLNYFLILLSILLIVIMNFLLLNLITLN